MIFESKTRRPKKRRLQKRRISKKRKRQVRIRRVRILLRFFILISIFILIVVGAMFLVKKLKKAKVIEKAPAIEEQFLTRNDYSRPGMVLEEINGIVIHYTANPETSAQNNRDYFEGLKDNHLTKASSHFIIGIGGEIIQCIPLNEIAYASNDRNLDTIAIECCHLAEDGKFTQETYDSLVYLVAWLKGQYELDVDDILRHYDVTGKNCPKYFVEDEEAWMDFKKDVLTYIDTYGKK